MDIFHTSHLRGNIVAWLPVKKTDRVCYMGKEEDAAAQKLRQMSDHLTCRSEQAALTESGEKYDLFIRLFAA